MINKGIAKNTAACMRSKHSAHNRSTGESSANSDKTNTQHPPNNSNLHGPFNSNSHTNPIFNGNSLSSTLSRNTKRSSSYFTKRSKRRDLE